MKVQYEKFLSDNLLLLHEAVFRATENTLSAAEELAGRQGYAFTTIESCGKSFW